MLGFSKSLIYLSLSLVDRVVKSVEIPLIKTFSGILDGSSGSASQTTISATYPTLIDPLFCILNVCGVFWQSFV